MSNLDPSDPLALPVARRLGNPAMVRGGPSLNPRGRPRLGESLAEAMRAKFPVEKIVELAADLAENATDERVRMVALQFIADRAYGKLVTTSDVTVNATDAQARVDWSAVPVERRRALADALAEVDVAAGDDESSDPH